MTDYQYEQIFREMSFDMVKDILKYTESPSKSIPRLLDEIREITGAKIVTIFRFFPHTAQQTKYELKMLGFNPKRKQNLIPHSFFEDFFDHFHKEKELFLIDEEKHIKYHQKLKTFGFDLSIVLPVVEGENVLGSFLILGLPTRFNLQLIIKGLKTLSSLFALSFKGSLFYMDMEQRVEERTRELRESERNLKNAQKMARMGNFELDLINHRLTWSEEMYVLYQLDSKAYTPTYEKFLNLIHPNDRATFIRTFEEHLNQKDNQYEIDHRVLLKSGDLLYVHHFCETNYDKNGKPIKSVGITHDITERKIHEIEITNREKKYRNILQTTNDGFWFIDLNGNILDVNDAYCKLSGYSRNELINMHISELEDIENTEITKKHITKVIERGQDRFESIHVRKDGSKFSVEVSTSYLKSDQGGHFIAFVRDITERKKADHLLRMSEARFRSVYESNMMGITFWNETGEIIDANDEFLRTIGYTREEFNKKQIDWKAITPDEYLYKDQKEVEEIIEKGVCSPFEKEYIKKNGDRVWVILGAASLKKDRTLGVRYSLDITESKRIEKERKNLQSQLTQAQKMEAVGRLAGGVAHDFNNMLSVIIGNCDLILQDLDDRDPIYPELKEVQSAAERSANLTKQLLTFARKQTITPKIVDINASIDNISKMLGRLIGEDIKFEWLPGEQLWETYIDPTQVDQILANLCVNARDAIEGIGKITIETKNSTINKTFCTKHNGAKPGDYLQISISDNGSGMSAETLENIFEPFYTTKGQGKGTGLGLATVYGIVKQNEGFINVKSTLGLGTTFEIFLPRTQIKNTDVKTIEKNDMQKGQETILLVEDEPAILKMTKKLLEIGGYTVISSNSPLESLKIAKEYNGNIDLLITDVIMPELNGKDLSNQIREVYPKIKYLYMSGYTANIIANQGVLNRSLNFLHKPFTKAELIKKVQDVEEM